MGTWIAALTWPEVRPRLEAGAVAVVAIGAAAKEHGPHLPMSTDFLTADALSAALVAEADVLAWPTLGYGHYPAFRQYAGSTSVPEVAFESTVRAIAQDLVRAGASRALVIDTGISTIRPVDAACADVEGASAVHVYRGARYLEAKARLCEQERGGHADEAETSVMLHLHPERVDMAKAPTWLAPIARGEWSPDDDASPSYAPSGVFGDATLASAEKGAALFEAMLEDLRDALTR